MPEIVVVGLGPGPVERLTLEAKSALSGARQVYFRFSVHPVFEWLKGQGVECISFDYIYSQPGITYDRIYRLINQALIKEAKRRGRVVYALPGNPCVFEKSPHQLKEECKPEGISVRVIPGMSFLELLYIELELDPEEGLEILNASSLVEKDELPPLSGNPLLIGHVGLPMGNQPTSAETNLKALAQLLLKKFPAQHPVTLVWCEGLPGYTTRLRTFPLSNLPEQKGFLPLLATLYVPHLNRKK
jgi:tetrapyrrole methylase family protein/MazG family protein